MGGDILGHDDLGLQIIQFAMQHRSERRNCVTSYLLFQS